jgi:hypothetical protein
MRVALAIALCACSIPDKHPGSSSGDGGVDGSRGPDGSTGPLRCLGQPLPTTAPPQIVLTVQTIDAKTAQPLANVTVTGLMLPPVTTDAQGHATLTATTNGVPVDSFVSASGAGAVGYATSHQYPSRPYDHDQQLVVPMLTFNDMATFASDAGALFDTSKAQLAIVVVDCDGSPLSGATVAGGGGQVAYTVSGTPTQGATATDATGVAYVFDAPAGTFTVAAQTSTQQALRSHTVAAPASDWTQAAIQP